LQPATSKKTVRLSLLAAFNEIQKKTLHDVESYGIIKPLAICPVPTQVFQRLTVANIKSAIKRVEVAERNRLRNKSFKSAVRTLMKSCLIAAEKYKSDPTPEALAEVNKKMSDAYSKIDKAVKKGVLHKNNGAHKKARLAAALKPAAVAA
jgi:small subunit ribosomal protein S20